MSDANDEMTDDELATRTKQLLGVAVGGAPSAPTVADIESRMSAQMAETEGRAAARSAVVADDSRWSSEARAVAELADYVTPAPDGGSRRGARWPRLALAAAAIVAVVAIGVALVARNGEDDVLVPAGGSRSNDAVVGVVPSTPPEGQVLTWIGSSSTEEGDGTMLRYHGYSGRQSLVITSTVFNQQPHPTDGTSTTIVVGTGAGVDPDSSGEDSVNVRMGDHSVLLTDEGRTARFVGPVGMVVEVTGEPDDVAAVVPTLETVTGSEWQAYLDQVSDDIESLPVAGVGNLLRGGMAVGEIATSGGRTLQALVVSLHGDVSVDANHVSSTSTGAVAGLCLSVDDRTTCRPVGQVGRAEGDGYDVHSSVGVIVDGTWWQYGWADRELSDVTMSQSDGSSGQPLVLQAYDESSDTSWFAAPLSADARRVDVEIVEADGTVSGSSVARPAT